MSCCQPPTLAQLIRLLPCAQTSAASAPPFFLFLFFFDLCIFYIAVFFFKTTMCTSLQRIPFPNTTHRTLPNKDRTIRNTNVCLQRCTNGDKLADHNLDHTWRGDRCNVFYKSLKHAAAHEQVCVCVCVCVCLFLIITQPPSDDLTLTPL